MGRLRRCLEVSSAQNVPETIASDRRCTLYWRQLSVRNHNLEFKTAPKSRQQKPDLMPNLTQALCDSFVCDRQ